MAAGDNVPPPPNTNQNGIDEKEIRKESSKAASKARQAQRKAYELRQAAYGAGDPEERQKLLEQAIDKEAEAESFGKMAKYMRRGSFQGMAVGAGLGVVPGLTLGTLTGMLVGGLVSTITGGLGAVGGAIVGAIHGPFWNVGEVAGKGIQKITGNLPGWHATDEQKWYLEKMLGQAKQEEMPTAHELEFLRKDDGSKDWGLYVEDAASYIPSTPSWMKSKQGGTGSGSGSNNKQSDSQRQQPLTSTPTSSAQCQTQAQTSNPSRTAARATNQQAGDDLARHISRRPTTQLSSKPTAQQTSTSNNGERRKPRKLNTKPSPQKPIADPSSSSQPPPPSSSSLSPSSTPATKRRPRKLERRSAT